MVRGSAALHTFLSVVDIEAAARLCGVKDVGLAQAQQQPKDFILQLYACSLVLGHLNSRHSRDTFGAVSRLPSLTLLACF